MAVTYDKYAPLRATLKKKNLHHSPRSHRVGKIQSYKAFPCKGMPFPFVCGTPVAVTYDKYAPLRATLKKKNLHHSPRSHRVGKIQSYKAFPCKGMPFPFVCGTPVAVTYDKYAPLRATLKKKNLHHSPRSHRVGKIQSYKAFPCKDAPFPFVSGTPAAVTYDKYALLRATSKKKKTHRSPLLRESGFLCASHTLYGFD